MSDNKRDQVLGHADEADGIEEYDNPLPAWWVGLFIVTIIFAVVYGADYHFVSKRSQASTYDAEVAAAEARWPQKAEVAAVTVTPEMVEAGRAIFQTNCIACHGPELKGGVGPDLTDSTWIHGGTYADISKTITNGVPDKGMLTWGPILGPEKISQVAAFVHGAGGGK